MDETQLTVIDRNAWIKDHLPEITLGEQICIKIKNIYYRDICWSKCYRDVSNKFDQLKRVARKFYSVEHKTARFYANKEELEMLKKLSRYSEEAIKDAFDFD
jgi:hypothetical protein